MQPIDLEKAQSPTNPTNNGIAIEKVGETELTPMTAEQGEGTAGIPDTGPDVAGIPDDLNEVILVPGTQDAGR